MAQSSRTRVETARLVGIELKMLDVEAGDALTPDEQTIIIEHIDDLHEELVEKGKRTWDVDAIPKAVVRYIAMIVADRAKTAFGKDYDRGGEGINGLNSYITRHAEDTPTKANYF